MEKRNEIRFAAERDAAFLPQPREKERKNAVQNFGNYDARSRDTI